MTANEVNSLDRDEQVARAASERAAQVFPDLVRADMMCTDAAFDEMQKHQEGARYGYAKGYHEAAATQRRQEAQIQAVRELHVPFEWSFGYGPVKSCKHCAEQGADEAHAQWPCPTIQALDTTGDTP